MAAIGDFFISYSQADKAWAEWIAWVLEEDGYQVLIQAWDFVPGSNWIQSMEAGTRDAGRTIVVLSSDYLKSVFGAAEWQAAWAKDPAGTDRKLLVVRVADAERPGPLARVAGVDLFGLDEHRARAQLRSMISSALAGRAKPSSPPEFPGHDRAKPDRAPSFPGAVQVTPSHTPDVRAQPEIWNLPPRDPNFTARRLDMAAIERELSAKSLVTVCLVAGTNAAGATQLAIEYAYAHAENYQVIWLTAAGGPNSIASQFASLAGELGLSTTSRAEQLKTKVYERLGSTRGWLLIFDTAAAAKDIQPWLPPTLSQPGIPGDVIVTTRQSGFEVLGPVIAVDLSGHGDESERLAGGVNTDLVDPNLGIPLGNDHLEVGTWVSMLATIIVDDDTPMPLSVGIFGEWGSGKSYFMGMLRSEIKRLSDSGQEHYLEHIEQIGFNAWHYADTNLWASLGDEIFRQLAEPGETPAESRQQLRTQLARGSAERQALEARTAQAREETARLQAELEAATAQRQYKAVDLLTAARSSTELRDQLDKVWKRLGIRDETEQARILADQVRGTVAETQTLRSLFRQRRSWVLLACFLIALAAVVVAALIPLRWGKWLDRGGVAALGVALCTGVTLLTRAREGLTQLGKIAADLSARARASAEQRTAEDVKPAIDGLRQAEADEKVAQAQLDEVVARVGQLASQLSDLMPGQRLYTFLTERAASGQYASQLGLISTIRKDFEHLVGLLRDWREEGTGEPARRPIDRIVLYIDDLDRCSPKQVVEVLQAVHLLLALDLFVVVVGVDPRWLVRSLRHQFPGNIDLSEGEPTAGEWNVPPHDYLEKIFNIPFVLPGIPAGGLGRVLRGFASANSSNKKNGTTGSASQAAHTAESNGSGGTPHAPPEPESAIPVEAHSELAASRDKTVEVPPRPLTEAELAFLSELGPCVGTPRAAKRLFNLYRMLRSTRDLTDASRFLGDDYTPGEYQAAAVLLGLLTADPQLLGQVLDAAPQAAPAVRGGLEHRPISDKWQGFVADFAPLQAGDGWTNKIVGRITPEDVPAWQRFAACAARLDHLITLPDLSPFQLWAPRIRRFSFLLAAPDDDSA